MESFQANSEKKTIRTKKGEIVYQEFSPKATKTALDDVDCSLASELGFTPDELDFIINYDIKYRMGGGDADDEGEGT